MPHFSRVILHITKYMEVDNEKQLKELKRVASAEQDFRVRRGWVGDCSFSVSLAELSDFKNGHNN